MLLGIPTDPIYDFIGFSVRWKDSRAACGVSIEQIKFRPVAPQSTIERTTINFSIVFDQIKWHNEEKSIGTATKKSELRGFLDSMHSELGLKSLLSRPCPLVHTKQVANAIAASKLQQPKKGLHEN